MEIKKHPEDLRILQECLIDFKQQGMDQDTMLKNLEKLRAESDSKTKDILLELMDFACRSVEGSVNQKQYREG